MEKGPTDRIDLQKEIGNKKALIMYYSQPSSHPIPIVSLCLPCIWRVLWRVQLLTTVELLRLFQGLARNNISRDISRNYLNFARRVSTRFLWLLRMILLLWMRGRTRLAAMLLYLSNSPLQFPPQNPPLSKFRSIIPPKVPVLQFALREIEINNRFASWRIHKENGLRLRDWTGMQPLFSGTDEVNVSLQS